MTQTGYTQGSGTSSRPASEGMDHERLKKQFLSYLDTKTEEISEQKDSRRYYHGAQWTAEQIKEFRKRRQPVVTYNRVARKINAIIGLLERQRQDPRGFPRTPQHEDGAELATAVMRYVLDTQEWPAISAACGLAASVDGIGGIELLLEQGDSQDLDVGMGEIDPSGFFYDPRSLKPDFSDARFMGFAKWSDLETAIEMFPDKEQELRESMESGSELTTHPDHEDKWFIGNADHRKIRLVDHWYIEKGEWHWCVYTGSVKLEDGQSPFIDERGKTFCKYVMFSANVDQDGDRYGFIRNMKSSQDEINQRRSKGLHILNSRRILIEKGTVANVEKLRTEAARPDGVIEVNPGTTPPSFDDGNRAAELTGHLGFLEDAKNEIENYGFNPALMGTGVNQMSGRAIALQQQAGISELGPYILSFRAWKLRVYRAIWNTVQRYWTSERWIRVTDDEQVSQFLAVNQLGIDPNTGMPTIVNAIGSLDVDIIIDEGPDVVNMQADAYDTLTIMAQGGQPIPPEVLIELSPLHGSVKKKIMEMIQQARQAEMQAAQPAMQMEMMGKQADIEETQANTLLKRAQATKQGVEAQLEPAKFVSDLQQASLTRQERLMGVPPT